MITRVKKNKLKNENIKMKNLHEQQLNLEYTMKQTAADKYFARVEQSKEKGDSSSLNSITYIIQKEIDNVSALFEKVVTNGLEGRPGFGVRASENLSEIVKVRKNQSIEDMKVDYRKIALASMLSMFDSIIKTDEGISKEALGTHIGKALRDEALYCSLEVNKSKNLKYKLQDFKNNHSSYSHMKTVIRFLNKNKWNEESGSVIFQEWSFSQVQEAGYAAIIVLEEALEGLIEKELVKKNKKTLTKYRLTDDGIKWLRDFDNDFSSTLVQYRPMVVKPVEWSRDTDGGYLDTAIPFMKSNAILEDGNFDLAHKVVNAIQSTPWVIDSYMLNVVSELRKQDRDIKDSKGKVHMYCGVEETEPMRPEILDDESKSNTKAYKQALSDWKQSKVNTINRNLTRLSKFLSQNEALRIANEYSVYDEIYFPWNLDSRCRIYPLPAILNPQASDVPKSLIRFKREVELTDDGMWWLGVNAANLDGFDKDSLDNRAKYSMEKLPLWKEVVKDPIAHVDVWVEGDKPFQFLQAMREYVLANEAWEKGEKFMTSLSVQVDGKCNGLQHYTLMMRDEVTAPYVGITKEKVSLDIYLKAADAALVECEKLAKEGEDLAKAWVELGISRKIAKRPTMTSVYSASSYGFSEQIKNELNAISDRVHTKYDNFNLAIFLGHLIDKNLKQVIGRGADAMEFIKKLVSVYAKYHNENTNLRTIQWTNPIGIKLQSRYMKRKSKKVSVRLNSVRLQVVENSETDEMNSRKMMSAMCPNFVHSIDASHLMFTVLKCIDSIQDFGFIHDSFGTHASNVDHLVECIKEAAIEIHEKNLLEQLRDEIAMMLPPELEEELPEIPEFGTLDINIVRESDNFFA